MSTAGHIHIETKRSFTALWFWLRNTTRRTGAEILRNERSTAAATTVRQRVRETGNVLRFPLRGEALLVRLAELLRRRVEELVPQSDRLSLTLSHRPMLRLAIDENAYVEFDSPNSEFNLVIEAQNATRMIIQTADFDSVVKFVLQYVLERLADDAVLEAAS